MSDYIFTDHPDARELRRLRLLERARDAQSIALLERTGLSRGAACLEIGAGAGSLVEWMAARVGPSGRVVALDRKTVHLRRFIDQTTPPVQVLEADLADAALTGPFDLIHARYVLIHNRDAVRLLRRVRDLLAPGGWVVLEEPDFTSAAHLQPTADAAMDRVHAAIVKMFENGGLDPGYGLRLPLDLARTGFRIAQTETHLHLDAGQAPMAALMGESASALRAAYTKTGLATNADIDHYVARAGNSDCWAVWYATVAVLAQHRTE